MAFKIVCSDWIKEADAAVLTLLRESDRCLSVEELSAVTGLPVHRTACALQLLKQ